MEGILGLVCIKPILFQIQVLSSKAIMIDKSSFSKHHFQLDNIHHQDGEGYPPVTWLPAHTQFG